MKSLIYLRNKVLAGSYKTLLKPIFFRLEPEYVHDRMISAAHFFGSNSFAKSLGKTIFGYSDPILEQEVAGLYFKNPVGLAAGFDKNAKIINFLPSIGFGFEEVGSITARKCAGNDGWHIKRLPKSKSILVNYGLMNDGADVIKNRVAKAKEEMIIGTNLAFTNDNKISDVDGAITDYAYSFRVLQNTGDYFTINISCPNRTNDRMFWEPENLERLLKRLFEIETKKPVFLKLSPDMPEETLDKLLDTATRFPIAGFVIGNLTKNRNNPHIKDKNIPEKGGMSGRIVSSLADKTLSYVYKKTRGKYPIIACGGIFSAEDAYRKIKLGATLVQLITGMIFEGPQLVSDINFGLANLLRKDGFKSVPEAVGKDNEIV